MPKLSLVGGTTSKILHVFIQDSSKTTGAGLSGLTNNSSGFLAHYIRSGDSSSTSIAVTSAAIGTFTSGGFIEVESSAMPGLYEFGLPNAVVSAGANKSAVLYLTGASNMAPCVLEIEITKTDNQDGTRGGMTALPNANAATNGGLPTTGNGANQISVSGGAVLLQIGTGTGQVQVSAGQIQSNVVQWNNANVATPNVTGVPKVDVVDWLGAAVSASTAGFPDVNARLHGNTLQTGRDIGASVLLSPGTGTGQVSVSAGLVGIQAGTGTGQLDYASGVVKTNVAQWLGVAVSATSGGIPDVNVFNYRNKSAVVDGNNLPSVNVVDIAGSASTGASGYMGIDWGQVANKTTVNALTNTTISTTQVVSAVNGSVGSVLGNIGGNVSGSVGSVVGNVTVSGSVTVGAYAAGKDPATLVLDVSADQHDISGTIGAEIAAAAGGGGGGTVNANVIQWNGAAVATPDIAGVPKTEVIAPIGGLTILI